MVMAQVKNRGQFHGANDFEGEDFQSNPRHHIGAAPRPIRLLPGPGRLAALVDGVGQRPATRGTTAGMLPAIYRASGFIESFAEDHSQACGQPVAAGRRNHSRPARRPSLRKAAPCSITARRRSSVPSTRPAANSTASSVNPSAEPSSYPQIPRTRHIFNPAFSEEDHQRAGRELLAEMQREWENDWSGL